MSSKSRPKPTGPWYCDPTISHHDGFVVLASVKRTPMSALGQKRTFAMQKGMSALPPKADMCSATRYVRFVPIADILPPPRWRCA